MLPACGAVILNCRFVSHKNKAFRSLLELALPRLRVSDMCFMSNYLLLLWLNLLSHRNVGSDLLVSCCDITAVYARLYCNASVSLRTDERVDHYSY